MKTHIESKVPIWAEENEEIIALLPPIQRAAISSQMMILICVNDSWDFMRAKRASFWWTATNRQFREEKKSFSPRRQSKTFALVSKIKKKSQRLAKEVQIKLIIRRALARRRNFCWVSNYPSRAKLLPFSVDRFSIVVHHLNKFTFWQWFSFGRKLAS